MNTLLLTDFYKIGHKFQYPQNTQVVYSNFTARTSRLPGITHTVFFGLQYFIKKYLIEDFKINFFGKPLNEVLSSYKRVVNNCLGGDLQNYEHIVALHNLGYLPLEIKALPEGSIVPIKVPYLTIQNTIEDSNFSWLVNWVESLMSSILWQPITSATIALEYRKILTKYAIDTGVPIGLVNFQAHDFSFRGMSSLDSAISSGIGHLMSFCGTDTIPAILAMEKYYNASSDDYLIGCSIPATEHSVMCAGGLIDELSTFKRLINEVYPAGMVSIVSDTWDLWRVLTEYLPILKNDILCRKGKVVIRPDSGDPLKILCGDEESCDESAKKGVIELLWDVFGGNINALGYKELHQNIGAVYGDSITLDICKKICIGLERKGFASSNIVFGIGSYTYQYNTRDTFGMAMKATFAKIDNVNYNLFKKPITDNGTKKSATGLLQVIKENGDFCLKENVSFAEAENSELETVFKNGVLIKDIYLKDIRLCN